MTSAASSGSKQDYACKDKHEGTNKSTNSFRTKEKKKNAFTT
jgi:hypothetical protein